eukprot:365440-Chlamydomonas_euryale.AAC.8
MGAAEAGLILLHSGRGTAEEPSAAALPRSHRDVPTAHAHAVLAITYHNSAVLTGQALTEGEPAAWGRLSRMSLPLWAGFDGCIWAGCADEAGCADGAGFDG